MTTDTRLIETVVRSVLQQLRLDPAAAETCRPDAMSHWVNHGACRFGFQAGDAPYPSEIARMIDHTLLKADATRANLETLCNEARQHGFATVCVNPAWVRLCADLLRGCDTRVCTVAGFPLGATPPEVKAYETARAIADGASEVDMVINIGALKSGDYRLVERDVAGVAETCRKGGAISKVIIEAALLTDDEKVKACVIAKLAGADFVKTSTGFGPGGATAADIALMRRVVGPEMGVKAAGGVRDLKSAQAMIDAGADRIGASVGVKIVQESQGAVVSSAAPQGY